MLFLSLWAKTIVHDIEYTWFPVQLHSWKAISASQFHTAVFKFLELEQISIIQELQDDKKHKRKEALKQ